VGEPWSADGGRPRRFFILGESQLDSDEYHYSVRTTGITIIRLLITWQLKQETLVPGAGKAPNLGQSMIKFRLVEILPFVDLEFNKHYGLNHDI
jgi:hypothetical protein